MKMKTIISFLACIIPVGYNTIYSQSFESNITVNYDMYIMFKVFPYYTSTLEFNNSKSLFIYKQAGENPTSKRTSKVLKGGDYGNSVTKVDSIIKRIYADKDNNLLLPYDKKQ